MPLIKGGAYTEDNWCTLDDGAALPGDGDVIVPLERAMAEQSRIAGRNGRTGVSLPNSSSVDEIAGLLPYLDLIALAFPAFTDGRAYSQARQLRARLRFEGEIRATGAVFADQASFMKSAGFDAFEISGEQPLETWNRASKLMSLTYQRGYDGDAATPDETGRYAGAN